jgi:hypothetical protein
MPESDRTGSLTRVYVSFTAGFLENRSTRRFLLLRLVVLRVSPIGNILLTHWGPLIRRNRARDENAMKARRERGPCPRERKTEGNDEKAQKPADPGAQQRAAFLVFFGNPARSFSGSPQSSGSVLSFGMKGAPGIRAVRRQRSAPPATRSATCFDFLRESAPVDKNHRLERTRQ